ncbi:MAG: hypothetical protein O9346_17860, partial [Leptospiraceae bacterium]|nr:hypothetical protein [Leptospiraceae bacterium]MCZ8348281.1 hypothetical protein [Leptospiraceae bacterium]
IHSPLDDLFGALGTIGGGLIGSLGLAFGRKREDEITGEATVRDGKVEGDKPPVPDSLIDPIGKTEGDIILTDNGPEIVGPDGRQYPVNSREGMEIRMRLAGFTNTQVINASDTKTERQSSINKESTPTRILDKNPQSSLIINSYNEKIVKSLQDIEKNRSILIQKETNRESILNSDEGFLLKQNESNAKYALESIERSLNDVNIKHSEAIAQYNKYAADYGILIVKGQLDPKAFDGLMKNHYEGILKPAEDELNLANKSKLPLINKYKSEVKIATEKTNKYVEIQSKKIKEGITNSKILEATKLLSKLNSADIDPKLKAAYEKLELAEKNLNNTKAEPGTKEYKKIMDAYLKEKKSFLNSDVGRDIAKQIDLAERPKVDQNIKHPDIPQFVEVKDTNFRMTMKDHDRISAIEQKIQGDTITNPDSRRILSELTAKIESEQVKADLIKDNIRQLEEKKQNQLLVLASAPGELKKIETELMLQKAKLNKSESELNQSYTNYETERLYAKLSEDPSMNTGLPVEKPENISKVKDAIYDLFHSPSDVDRASAGNYLVDYHGITLGESKPIGSKELSSRQIPTDSGLPQQGAGHIRYMDFYGHKMLMPGVPGSPITSPMGGRLDPQTGRPATHMGVDNAMPVGTVVGIPVNARVVSTSIGTEQNHLAENSRHAKGSLGQQITFQLLDKNGIELPLRMQIGHNSSILVEPVDKKGNGIITQKPVFVKAGQAVVTSGSSGRSIGTNENGSHTHTQFLRAVKNNQGEFKYEHFIPSANDIELLRKAGLLED